MTMTHAWIVIVAGFALMGYFFGNAAGYAKGYDDGSRRRSLGGRIWR